MDMKIRDNMVKKYVYNTIIGPIEIVEEDGYILRLDFSIDEKIDTEETSLIKETYKQIEEYLLGNRKKFIVPIKLKGTEFQKKVWNALLEIPYGETMSYKKIAEKIGNPKACRAVGMANHNTIRISIVIE